MTMPTKNARITLYACRLLGRKIIGERIEDGTSGTNSWSTFAILIDGREIDLETAARLAGELGLEAPTEKPHEWFFDEVSPLLEDMGVETKILGGHEGVKIKNAGRLRAKATEWLDLGDRAC